MSVIDQHHREFAQALVALAREHKMDRLNVTFQKSFHHPDRETPYEAVDMTWEEGRHMASAAIRLSVKSTISEKIEV